MKGGDSETVGGWGDDNFGGCRASSLHGTVMHVSMGLEEGRGAPYRVRRLRGRCDVT